jgi:hypothetical protein
MSTESTDIHSTVVSLMSVIVGSLMVALSSLYALNIQPLITLQNKVQMCYKLYRLDYYNVTFKFNSKSF